MNTDPPRPDPDALLDRIEAEEKKARRGKLKIFFGSSAGVGKTYAMLAAAHEKLNEGVDIAIGIVETHKRPETEKLLEGLRILAPLQVNYRGVVLDEMDLDAALTRKPDILLVDELAHSNPPSMRHPKRWNDVMELLDAGIDVYTTLNVQHIESLADLVAGATGVWVKETVPDSVFDAADDIMLVDIDADDLLKRLAEGKVYVAPGVKARAAENFFKKSNLIALRELALRRMAERVDAEMDAWSDSEDTRGRLPIAEKILVCIGPDALSSKLVRSVKRLASALRAPWAAVYVENERHFRLNNTGRRKVEAIFRMVERIGGKTFVIHGDNPVDAIIGHARAHHFTKIMVGKPLRSPWQLFFRGSLADKIIRKSGNIDVYVVTSEYSPPSEPLSEKSLSDFEKRSYLWALVMVVGATALGILWRNVLAPVDLALIYLTGIVLVAAKFGRGPSLLYSMLSVGAFNYFFAAPLHKLRPGDSSYLMTFLVMLITGYVIATQASKLRTQMLLARDREKRTQTLYRLTRELTSTRGRKNVADVAALHIAELLNVDVTIWLPDSDGHLEPIVGALPAESFIKERSVLQWCFDNAKTAGRATETMPGADGLYLPLSGSAGTLGVLGMIPRNSERVFSLDEISTLETVGSLLASAQERVKAGELALQAKVAEENEKLRLKLLKAQEEMTS
jgi:two-component system, OmpR family, sensor histidine kinase KdpD